MRCRAGDAHPARCASIARASTTPGTGQGFGHICLPGKDFGGGEGGRRAGLPVELELALGAPVPRASDSKGEKEERCHKPH